MTDEHQHQGDIPAEIELYIERTAYRVATEVVARSAKNQEQRLLLHEAKCPGRQVGKIALAVVSVLSAGIGAAVMKILLEAF